MADDFDGLETAFTGPRRMRWLLRALRRTPPGFAGGVMAALALAQAPMRERRLARALRFSRAQGFTGWQRYQTALATIANHGRYVTQEAMIGAGDRETLRASSAVIGGEQLQSVRRGALLVGMHMGPPRSWLYLRAHGYPVRVVIRDTAGAGEAWNRWRDRELVVPLSLDDAAARVQGLYRVRRLLAEGELVFMTADGPLGATVFTLDLRGAAPPIRAGWFTLRRLLRVPAFPAFIHEDRGRRIVTIHSPLPAVDENLQADADACRAALNTLVRAYVLAHPRQCRYLAFPPWR